MADDDPKPDKKGFWGSLFRNKSPVNRLAEKDTEPRRVSDSDLRPRRRHVAADEDVPVPGARRRSRRSDGDAATSNGSTKSNGRRGSGSDGHGRTSHGRPALTSWPPSRLHGQQELTIANAIDFVSQGAPAHRGHKRPIPYAPEDLYALYSTTSGGDHNATDGVSLHDSMTQFMTLSIQGAGSGRSSESATYPWDTLEQPSYAFYFGRNLGTTTLNQWISLSGYRPRPVALRDSGVQPRETDLPRILERINEIQSTRDNPSEQDVSRLYHSLYRRFLRDPDVEASNGTDTRNSTPQIRPLDRQITDLILALSRPGYWVDFSDLRNQVATRFIFDNHPDNAGRYTKFFHQLLLSLELEIRIQAKSHSEPAKEKLLTQLPPKIRWDLALAKRWRENVRVDGWGQPPGSASKKDRSRSTSKELLPCLPEDVKLRYKLKKRQMRMLKRFAQVMRWPNLAEMLARMRELDEKEDALDAVSSDAMAFFSGLILPGPTFPFLIMNALIDIDPDTTTDSLALLTHLSTNCGFQHRSSYTYWTATSIVGKVLAPTCHALAGWIGPARPSPDLGRSEIVKLKTKPPPQSKHTRLTPEDVLSMSERSDPLGPAAEKYPVDDYALVKPKHEPDDQGAGGLFDGVVRIEKLGFSPAWAPVSCNGDPGTPFGDVGESHSLRGSSEVATGEPKYYFSTLQVAIDGVSWPLHLDFDVEFVSAWPCQGGPHPLFFDYVYDTVRADQVVDIKDWGRTSPHSLERGIGLAPAMGPATRDGKQLDLEDEVEKVLVIEAFGVPDNEVLARAWCAHWGLGALVADINDTCVACAVREAYAATLIVVILINPDDVKGEREG